MDASFEAIEIDNRVFGAEPRKTAINDALRAALASVPGEWRVVVSEVTHLSPPWWWISVEGGGTWLELSFRPWEQRADVLQERLSEALRSGGVHDV